MILSINSPHFSEEKLQVRADFLALSVIPHMFNSNTNAAFQQFVLLKSSEGEITCCTEAANFISSQQQMGVDYQITTTTSLRHHTGRHRSN